MAFELANYLEHLGDSESLLRVSSLSIGELLETLVAVGASTWDPYSGISAFGGSRW